MTNHWIDIKNADVIMIMGSNAAENHPISFRWVEKAIENGATLISVDPRFTRTSSRAHIYAPIRSGADIAFLGGMIKYILDNDLQHTEYVAEHTNASFLINPDFDFDDGLFVGYNPDKRSYDNCSKNTTAGTTWRRCQRSPARPRSCCNRYMRHTPAAAHATGWPPLCTLWAGRSTPTAPRLSARRP
jgi:anaerobic selenocysteine-containing dehydrogenase